MTALPHNPSMLHLGTVAQNLGRNAEGMDQKLLNKIMIGCICITAISGAAQVFIALKDSLDKKRYARESHAEDWKTRCFDRDEVARRSR